MLKPVCKDGWWPGQALQLQYCCDCGPRLTEEPLKKAALALPDWSVLQRVQSWSVWSVALGLPGTEFTFLWKDSEIEARLTEATCDTAPDTAGFQKACLFPRSTRTQQCMGVRADGGERLFAQPWQAAADGWGKQVCRGAGGHCSVDEGWAARPPFSARWPLYLQCWQVLDVVKGFIAGNVWEEMKQQTLVCRSSCQRVITPYAACVPHPLLFQHPYVLDT